MNKLTTLSRRFLDRFCKYLLILLFFASFALSIFYAARYYLLDLEKITTATGEIVDYRKFAYLIDNRAEFGISLLGSVLCGAGLLIVAAISAYGISSCFGLFSVPKDSSRGRKCLILAAVVGTIASFILIMGFLLCGTHTQIHQSTLAFRVTPPWHIWVLFAAFVLLLTLSVLGNREATVTEKHAPMGKNNLLSHIVLSALAVFCIITAVVTLCGQYKIYDILSGTTLKLHSLIGDSLCGASPMDSGLIVGNAFCAVSLFAGAALAILEAMSKYHHRFRSLGIIGLAGVLGFTHLYFDLRLLPLPGVAIDSPLYYPVRRIPHYSSEFLQYNLYLFGALLGIYVLIGILYALSKKFRKEPPNEEIT